MLPFRRKYRPVYAAFQAQNRQSKGFILPAPKMASNRPQARFRAFFVCVFSGLKKFLLTKTLKGRI
jgi:hypothetical protein